MAKYECVLVQRPDMDDGLTRNEIIDLLDRMGLEKGEEVDFVRFEGDTVIVEGFILLNTILYRTDFNLSDTDSDFARAVLRVVNDEKFKTDNHEYDFAGIHTFMNY